MATIIGPEVVNVTDGSLNGLDLLVPKDVNISSSWVAVYIDPFNDGTLKVKGTVTGSFYGLGVAGDNSTVTIAASGQVIGETGIGLDVYGFGNLATNRGYISGLHIGLSFNGDGTLINLGRVESFLDETSVAVSLETITGASFENAGVLRSSGYGLHVSSREAVVLNTGRISGSIGASIERDASLTNEGVIRGLDTGLYVDNEVAVMNSGKIISADLAVSSIGTLTLTNSGTIRGGGEVAISASDVLEITNSGKIIGDVMMGDSDDTYTGEGEGYVLGAVYGGAGGDLMNGNGEDEWFYGDAGEDLLRGGRGADSLFGGDDMDNLYGGGGGDHVSGEDGDDLLFGGKGDDTMRGGADDDIMFGEKGNDRMFGGEGDDQVVGQQGDDELSGGAGADMLSGGEDNDRLIGGAGADIFIYLEGDSGKDRIVDFTPGEDLIDLTALGASSAEIADFLDRGITQKGDDIVLNLGIFDNAEGKVVLEDVIGTLAETDFAFIV